jgi:hypothetical protein
MFNIGDIVALFFAPTMRGIIVEIDTSSNLSLRIDFGTYGTLWYPPAAVIKITPDR